MVIIYVIYRRYNIIILNHYNYFIIIISGNLVSLIEQHENEEEIGEILRNHPQGLLHEACNQGSVTSVKMLLERGVTTSEWDNVSSDN